MTPEAIRFYASEPVYFTEDIIKAKPDRNQIAILNSVRDYPMTTVRSGHGIGKTAVESWVLIWFLLTRPFPKIPCTAPTQHQLFDILWAEVSKWLRNNPELQKEITWTQEKIYFKGYKEEWFAVPRTATNPDALQGFHADHLLFILDEASGISDKTFEPVLGALTGPDAKLLMMGNPTRLAGFFFDSHHKSRSSYNAMHVDGRNSEHVGKGFVQKIIDMFGEDSDVFRVRVAGQFPKAQPDSFISMEMAEVAAGLKIETQRIRLDLGVDVARYGDDSSVVYPVFDLRQSDVPAIYHHNDTMELSGEIILKLLEYALEPSIIKFCVKVDSDGLGVGVYDRLNEQRTDILDRIKQKRITAEKKAGKKEEESNAEEITLEIIECHFGASGGYLEEGDPVEFANSTGLMWGRIRKLIKDKALSIWNDDKLISQLSNRKYQVDSAGKIVLERKEDMKKRGVSSPDIADALALALYEPINYYTLNW